jgi:multiple antibiotic resistance protein
MWWFGDFLFDFLTIWVIIDPITVLPIFIAVTADCDRATRRRIAGFTSLIALAVLAFFIAAGQIIIIAMGISLHAFEISGGLILLLFAIDLVIGAGKPVATDEAGKASALQRAIYPLAIPSLAGPGAMLTVILRTDNSRISLLEQIHTEVAVALVLGITYLLLLSAGPITRAIGTGGVNVVKRVMGMVLAAYATTLILKGFAQWLNLPPV